MARRKIEPAKGIELDGDCVCGCVHALYFTETRMKLGRKVWDFLGEDLWDGAKVLR